MPELLLIAGSLRASSVNRKLAAEAGRLFDGTASFGSIDLPLYNGDIEDREGIPASVRTLFDQIDAADAVVIATPEYNQSFPGVLKNALDWVSRVKGNPWLDKPVALVSATAGRSGGARAQFALRLAMVQFQPRLLNGPEVMVAGAVKEFDEDDQLTNDRYLKSLTTLMEKLGREIVR